MFLEFFKRSKNLSQISYSYKYTLYTLVLYPCLFGTSCWKQRLSNISSDRYYFKLRFWESNKFTVVLMVIDEFSKWKCLLWHIRNNSCRKMSFLILKRIWESIWREKSKENHRTLIELIEWLDILNLFSHFILNETNLSLTSRLEPRAWNGSL